MDFSAALHLMLDGQKLRRTKWGDHNDSVWYEDERFVKEIKLTQPDEISSGVRRFKIGWGPVTEDLLADDWEVRQTT